MATEEDTLLRTSKSAESRVDRQQRTFKRLLTKLLRSRWLLGGLGLVIAASVWQAVGDTTNPILFTTPTRVVGAWPQVFRDGLWSAYWLTMRVFIVVFVVSSVTGVAIGIITGLSSVMRRLTDPLVAALYGVPVVALIPVLVLWFGVGGGALVALVAYSVVFPVLINTQLGIDRIDAGILELGTSFGAKRWETIRTIMLPATVPYIVAGLRIAAPRGLVAIISGELLISETGLGGLAYAYGNAFETAKYFVPITLLVVTSLAIAGILNVVDRRLSRWRV
jgi:ABC-type nitrate/sulfonate/bicarbonate transport system permease component